MARKSKTQKRRQDSDVSVYRPYYSTSSTAHKVHESDSQIRRAKTVKNRGKRQRGIRYIYNFGTNPHSLGTYLVMCVIFLGCLSCVFIYSFTWSLRRNINLLETELKSLQETNIAIEAGISSSYDLFTIEKKALALGMSSPQPHQIVYISVPKETYIEQYKPISDINTEVKLSNIIDILFGER